MVHTRAIAPDCGNLGFEALWVDPVYDIPADPRAPIIMHARSLAIPENESDLILHSWRVIWVSGTPIGTHPVRICVRCACFAKSGRTARNRKKDKDGGKTEPFERLVRAPLPDIVPGHRITCQLLDHIRVRGVTQSIVEVTRETGVSASVVERLVTPIRHAFVERYRPEAPRWLALDEVHFGHKKFTVLSDAETQRIIDLLPDARQETVEAALRRLGNLGRVEAAVCDLFAAYLAALATVLPKVPVVADRWHVQKLATEAFDEVRSAIFKQPVKKGDFVGRALRQNSGLLNTPRHKLSPADRKLLGLLLLAEPTLNIAYKLAKDFYGLYAITSKRAAEDYFDRWTHSIPPELDGVLGRLARTINQNRAIIFRYWDYRETGSDGKKVTLTTSPAENANKKINPLLSQGMVKHSLLRQMVLLKFGPLTPWEVVQLALQSPAVSGTSSERPADQVMPPVPAVLAEPISLQLFGETDILPERALAERLGTAGRLSPAASIETFTATARPATQLSLLTLMGDGHGLAV